MKWFKGGKTLTDDQIDEWDKRIGNIPETILYQLVDQIIDTNKFMPTPGEMKKLYGEFRRYHPNQFLSTDQEQEFCRVCKGEGLIIAWKITETFPYEYALACGHCNNWKRMFPTRPSGPTANSMPPKLMKIEDIMKDGYVLEDPWKKEKPAQKEYQNIDEMAEAVGSSFQDEIPF